MMSAATGAAKHSDEIEALAETVPGVVHFGADVFVFTVAP